MLLCSMKMKCLEVNLQLFVEFGVGQQNSTFYSKQVFKSSRASYMTSHSVQVACWSWLTEKLFHLMDTTLRPGGSS